ncbi:hypothetical protein [Oceanobacillus manasiensis]|uniref:hypothetical protein n=1 Tax=Oceanobacillus manasiensis TaxID=586413 RepID=UPI0005A77071|nr:hypothetical protein [Oceanobacillus manasiensis]
MVEPKSFSKQNGDFILHISVNQVQEGIEVRQSIQYIGEQSIEIKHQSPLVSVALKDKKHTFTGSMVTKKLSSGNIYYPQDPIVLPNIKNIKNCSLYVKARLFTESMERINIEHVEELKLN